MEKFEYKVKVQASSKDMSKRLLKAMFDIKAKLSEDDLLSLASLLKENPGLIKQAKRYL